MCFKELKAMHETDKELKEIGYEATPTLLEILGLLKIIQSDVNANSNYKINVYEDYLTAIKERKNIEETFKSIKKRTLCAIVIHSAEVLSYNNVDYVQKFKEFAFTPETLDLLTYNPRFQQYKDRKE